MEEAEQLCKEFGGLTDEQAREKLKGLGITVEEGPIPHASEKIWKRQVKRLCDPPRIQYPRKILPVEAMAIPTGYTTGMPELAAIHINYQEFRIVEMGYNHWVDDVVEAEPGNGYFVHYRWYYWVKNGDPKPLHG